MNVSVKICPVCQSSNDIEAIYCIHCGAALDGTSGDTEHRTKTTDMQALTPEMIQDWVRENTKEAAIPATGIAFYVDGHSMPAYIDSQDEFVLGRKVGTTSELLLDLAPFRGVQPGSVQAARRRPVERGGLRDPRPGQRQRYLAE